MAVRDAFDSARRRLEDHARRHDHRGKVHEFPPSGHITRLIAQAARAQKRLPLQPWEETRRDLSAAFVFDLIAVPEEHELAPLLLKDQ